MSEYQHIELFVRENWTSCISNHSKTFWTVCCARIQLSMEPLLQNKIKHFYWVTFLSLCTPVRWSFNCL